MKIRKYGWASVPVEAHHLGIYRQTLKAGDKEGYVLPSAVVGAKVAVDEVCEEIGQAASERARCDWAEEYLLRMKCLSPSLQSIIRSCSLRIISQ